MSVRPHFVLCPFFHSSHQDQKPGRIKYNFRFMIRFCVGFRFTSMCVFVSKDQGRCDLESCVLLFEYIKCKRYSNFVNPFIACHHQRNKFQTLKSHLPAALASFTPVYHVNLQF